jgi:hypothetical protein
VSIRAGTVNGVTVVLALMLVGCGGGPQDDRQVSAARASQTPAGRPSQATGAAQVKKNQTTQAEVLKRFGPPSISTADAAGVETWLYEHRVGESIGPGANELDAFFQDGRRRMSDSGNTVTVIIEFNPDTTVRDYAIRKSTR